MTVKQKYSHISETLLYELSLTEQRGLKHHYAYWISVKDRPTSELKLSDLLRIDKISELHLRLLRRKR